MGDLFIKKSFDVTKIVQDDMAMLRVNAAKATEMVNPVIDTSSAVQAQNANKGTGVERTATSTEQGEPISEKTSCEVTLVQLGIPNAAKDKFKTYLQQQGVTIDEQGKITIECKAEDLANKIELFREGFEESLGEDKSILLADDAKETVQFEGADEATISKLIENGVISKSDTEGVYTIKNQEVFKQKFTQTTQTEKIERVPEETSEMHEIEVTSTTTTVTKKDKVPVPEGVKLRDGGEQVKQYKEAVETTYRDMVDKADKPTRGAIDLYVAERKYNKAIDEKVEELRTYEVTKPDGKTVTTTRDDADVIEYYIKNYADDNLKEDLNNTVKSCENTEDTKMQAEMLKALKEAKVLGVDENSSFENLKPDLKHKAALLVLAKSQGLDANSILRLVATKQVMDGRSEKQIKKDDEYFVKEQTKDYVKGKQAEQDFADTVVHFSAKGAKADGNDPSKIHNDIGKHGQNLVKSCPDVFCDEASADQANDPEVFSTEVTGKDGNKVTKYYKFNQDKWKNFAKVMCDPRMATDEELDALFGKDGNRPTKRPDMNMTLQEARNNLLQWKMPTSLGETGTLPLETIIGNADDKANWRETRRLRRMVETTGLTTDIDRTIGKRMLHVLQNAAVGTAAGFLTGGGGSLLAGAVTVSGTTAARMVSLTGEASLPYSVTTQDVERTIVNGETFTDVTTHITNGETTGKVTLTDKVDGQDWSGQGNNYLKTAGYSGLLGGLAGIGKGLIDCGNVFERGRNIDDVFDLVDIETKEEPKTEKVKVPAPKYQSTEVKKSTIEADAAEQTAEPKPMKEVPKVPYRGTEAYSRLYQYEDGTPVNPNAFSKAYKQQVLENNGNMPQGKNFPLPDELMIGDRKIVLKSNYEDEAKKIKKGDKGGTERTAKVNNPNKAKQSGGGKNVTIKATITKK